MTPPMDAESLQEHHEQKARDIIAWQVIHDSGKLADVMKRDIVAALREERARVIEECAKVALADHPDKYTNWNDDFNHGQAYASDCIRALKDKP